MDTLINIIKVISIIILVVCIFNVIILVHELGHYWAAKWRGLVVEKFQIWFGKPIWKKTINGVQWGIGCIPAGGFVALPQMAPMDAIEGESSNPSQKLPPIKPIDKIIVAFAGPLFSFMLAIVFAFCVYLAGKPISRSQLTTTIGYVDKDMSGHKAGLKAGDKILEIDNNPVYRWLGIGNDVQSSIIIKSRGEKILFKVKRDNETLSIPVGYTINETQAHERPGFRRVGIYPFHQPMIAQFAADKSPAKESGMKKYDIIRKINDIEITSSRMVNDMVKNSNGDVLKFEVSQPKNKDIRTLSIKPKFIKEYQGIEINKWAIGIIFDMKGEMSIEHPNPINQITSSVVLMYDTITALFSSKSGVSTRHLNGPVAIINYYYLLFLDDNGWRLALWFSVILNINLAIINLLPFPILDGGHIGIAFIEMLRGKPIKNHILEKMQIACFFLIFGFIIYVTFFDVQDLSIIRKMLHSK